MTISASLMYARLSSTASTGTGLYKKARVGAFRLGYYGPHLCLSVNGTLRHTNFDRDSWRVTEKTGGVSKTLTIEVFGFTPAKGQEIILGAGSLSHRLFRGTITRIRQVRGRLNEGRIIYTLTCVDCTYALMGVPVTTRYVAQTATAILLDLMTLAPAGYTTTHVQRDLDVIDEIVFTMRPLPLAIQDVMDRIGGTGFFDYEKDLHAYGAGEGVTLPQAITSSNPHVRSFDYTEDIDGLWNRIFCEGIRTSVIADVSAGASTIPVDNQDAYANTGGPHLAKLDQQVTSYTGTNANADQGSEASGIPQGPSAPSAAAIGGTPAPAGGVLGVVSYKLLNRVSNAHSDQSDDSETSAASGTVTIAAVAAPSSAPSPTISTTNSGDMEIGGAYRYKVTFGTPLGETLASAATGGFTIPTVAAPTGVTLNQVSGQSGDIPVGLVNYKFTYETANGETALGSASGITITAVSAPGTSGTATAAAAVAGGNLGLGTVAATFLYKVTYVTTKGETLPAGTNTSVIISKVTSPGAASAAGTSGGSLTLSAQYNYVVMYGTAVGNTEIGTNRQVTLVGAQNAVSLTGIPTSGDARVTKRFIFRSIANDNSRTWYYLVGTINDNTTTSFTDTTADSALSTYVSGDYPNTTAYDQVNLTSIPTSSDARVTARKIYRSEANQAVYKLLTTLNNNSTTTFTDNVADPSLGDPAPAADTSGGAQIAITAIPLSSDGRVLRRKIYRQRVNSAGSDPYYYAATLNDNTTTSYTDSKGDDSLGERAADTDTSQGGQITLASVATSASTRVTKRLIYRTKRGGSIYYRVGTIGDNTTTTFTDNVADANLGDAEPAQDDSGGGQVTVTIPVGPAGVTGRKIYRTEGGGTVYKYLATVNDNTTTTYVDKKDDTELGDADIAESQVRTLAGATSLPVKDLSQFPASGWAKAGSQVFSYTARAASSGVGNLTGIPASGNGSLAKDVTYGTDVTSCHFLTGIPAAGAQYALAQAIAKGASISILETDSDATSIATYGDRAKFVSDSRLSRDGCVSRIAAELALQKDPRITASLRTTDLKMRAGKPLTINVTEWGLSASVTVQDVTLQPGTDASGTPWPQPMASASVATRSIEDLMTQLRMVRDQLARSA